MVHWTNQGVVLRHDTDANRIDVLYNDTTKQYVMFLKYDGNGAFLGIATAEKPEGPFTFKSKTLVDDARMGDMSVFKDSDGRVYLCYVSWAVGTNAQHGIYRMSDDYLTLDKRIFLWDIRSREAPHIFKRNGIYYYGTSRTAGIQSSGTSYYTVHESGRPLVAGQAALDARFEQFVGFASRFCLSDPRDERDVVHVCRRSLDQRRSARSKRRLRLVADGIRRRHADRELLSGLGIEPRGRHMAKVRSVPQFGGRKAGHGVLRTRARTSPST